MAAIWFEIHVQDMERATKFYEYVFKVTLEDVLDVPDESHTRSFPMAEPTDGASGALVKSELVGPCRGGTVVYFEVEDCAVEEARAVEAGGTVVDPKKSIGPHGFMSVCQDLEGNLFGLHSMQ